MKLCCPTGDRIENDSPGADDENEIRKKKIPLMNIDVANSFTKRREHLELIERMPPRTVQCREMTKRMRRSSRARCKNYMLILQVAVLQLMVEGKMMMRSGNDEDEENNDESDVVQDDEDGGTDDNDSWGTDGDEENKCCFVNQPGAGQQVAVHQLVRVIVLAVSVRYWNRERDTG